MDLFQKVFRESKCSTDLYRKSCRRLVGRQMVDDSLHFQVGHWVRPEVALLAAVIAGWGSIIGLPSQALPPVVGAAGERSCSEPPLNRIRNHSKIRATLAI